MYCVRVHTRTLTLLDEMVVLPHFVRGVGE
jgi:hypothetical protein